MEGLPPLPRRGPVEFHIDHDRFTLPDLPTPVWLDAFAYAMPNTWMQLIPGQLTTAEQHRLGARLANRRDPLDIDHIEKHAMTVLGAVCGVEFHVAQRLIVAARSDWMLFDGWCAAHNVDPYNTHISRLCNIAFRLRLEACEKDSERHAVRARLWAPPEGSRASGRSWDDDPDVSATLDRIESDAFMSMFG